MPRKALYRTRSDEWLLVLKMKLRSQNTMDTYENALKQCWEFAKEMDWPSDPKKIAPEHILEWYEELMDSSSNTQEIYTSTLLRFLEWAGNTLCKDVDLHIQPARTGRVDWMDSPEEVGRFIGSARNVWERAIAIVISYTGARASEAADLSLCDMHPEYVRLRGKGRKERNIPVDKEFWEELQPYIQYRSSLKTRSERFLVHLWQGKVWEYNGHTINQVIKNLGKAFGRHISPHTLRRTFGRILWLAGCPLPIIQKLLGHSTVEQTIEYLGVGDADLSGAVTKYRPSFRTLRENERTRKAADAS